MQRSNKAKKPSLEEEEICPVCKSSRYLNPSMQFRINPECYHKMCVSCIDRIFSSGPALCPIAGCGKTLRKAKFRPQTFSDIAVEREVDIRKKLAAIFNRREDEFESLDAWNQYLEEVETMTFDIIAGGPEAESTWEKVYAYEAENADNIAINAELAAAELLSAEARQAALKEAARRRRELAKKQDEAERAERDEQRTDLIEQLASGKDAVKLAERQRVNIKKPSSSSRRAGNAEIEAQRRAGDRSAFQISGLRNMPLEKIKDPLPFSPFAGARPNYQYHSLQESYENPYLDNATKMDFIIAGGYDVKEYFARTLCEAFAGLGVFADEKSSKQPGVDRENS